MKRVVVLGTSGSGKTTLARELAARMNVPHIELDALHWEPGWVEAPTEVMLRRVRDELDRSPRGWAVDGNYRLVKDEIWPDADTIVWLDYPMTLVFSRVLVRTLRRGWTRQELWSGNRERLWTQFFSRDSILLWVINTWRIRRRDYPKELADPRWRHARIVRLRTPCETEQWLARFGQESPDGTAVARTGATHSAE
jgi:adenylate kinase family enzyme